MFDLDSYQKILLSVTAGLLTLLGSVGIFVSLIIQRRVERLQDILEEFMDLSYHEDINLTGKMYKLIEKYQMHYLLPDGPSQKINTYINVTITLVIISWVSIMLVDFELPLEPKTALYFLPIISGLGVLVFYRHLINKTISPIDNSLLSPIIPPPRQLRSVSFLSKYVNVSVKSILKQARLRIICKSFEGQDMVILKEELSFDDYFYYLVIGEEVPFFIGFGKIAINFGIEPITGKPVPAAKNINIPLGFLDLKLVPTETIKATLFIFPQGEKHPVEYSFLLKKHQGVIKLIEDPEISVNYVLTYQVKDDYIDIIQQPHQIPGFEKFSPHFKLECQRWYTSEIKVTEPEIHCCSEEIFID
jgi:hypothetical protein